MSQNAKIALKEFLGSFEILSERDIRDFLELVTFKYIEKGSYFFNEGEVCQELGFIVSGMLHSFYTNSVGQRITYCFAFSGTFITGYSSFLSQTRTVENIQAMTDVELACISKEHILELERGSINWLRLSKNFAEQEYIKMEERILMLQTESAQQKYLNLLENHPEFIHHIPLKYLASYLGVTRRHLSRIRSTVWK